MMSDVDIFGGSMSGGSCMDELLAAIGYNVRSMDKSHVAKKLVHHETAMYNNVVNVNTGEDGTSSNIASNDAAVHFYDSVLTQNDTTLAFDQLAFSQMPVVDGNTNTFIQSHIMNDNSAAYAIPGMGEEALGNSTLVPEPYSDLTRPYDDGVRLVHVLMSCAEAIQQGNMKLAEALVSHAAFLAASQGGAMRKVASYFAHALARRIYGYFPNESLTLSPSLSDMLHVHFYETCPYLKFAHFTANQAILEAFSAATTVHVIDFGLKQGLQWPALMQALALRPGGPPSFRLTGIGSSSMENAVDALQEVGWRLSELARTINVRFEFSGFACNSLSDLDPTILDIRHGESVAVNAVFELHRLLAKPGSLEMVLKMVRGIRPEIVTVVEQEANHNGPIFLTRFTEAMHYYSSLFDSMEGSTVFCEDSVMSEVYLGKQISNVVACEGEERVERHETLAQWRVRMRLGGLEPVRLGFNAFRQARMLLALFAGGEGYRVEENDGCLLLGWQTRPLIATSAWRVAGAAL